MQNSHFISTTDDYLEGQDLTERLPAILEYLATTHGLQVQSQLGTSNYYGTGKVGAARYLVDYQGQRALLKIQGAKPVLSETKAIQAFSDQNASEIICPPQVLEYFPWQDELKFEVSLMEYLEGEKVLPPGQFHEAQAVDQFFQLYREYRTRCIQQPWLSLPENFSLREAFLQKHEQLLQISADVQPNHSLRQTGDQELISQAAQLLADIFQDVPAVFQHAHFSLHDLVKPAPNSNQVVLLSNLYWRWTYPYYDAIFGYHWFMYSLAVIQGKTAQDLSSQGKLWLERIEQLSKKEELVPELTTFSVQDRLKLVKAALLERAMAGLMIDAFAFIDDQQPLAQAVVARTRSEVIRLLDELH